MGSLVLQYDAVSAPLLDLLRELMTEELLTPFCLVGGTALGLQLGHRVSVDIDLFTDQPFDVCPVGDMLREKYAIQALETAKNTVRGEVGGIKLDAMAHQYPSLESPVQVDGIRMASVKDIAAMKLNAIANRGRKKDFWDYAELLHIFSKEEMLSFFARKYTDENVWYVEKSLSYFKDAEAEPSPRDLKGRVWEDVKREVLACNVLP